MSFKKLYIINFSALLVIFFLTGCASTSNVTRYGEKKESETHKTSDVRFTSENDENDKKVTISENNDSLAIRSSDNDSDADDLPANEPKMDISSVLKKISPDNSGNFSSDNGTPKERMLMEIIKYINTPYKYGGNSHNGISHWKLNWIEQREANIMRVTRLMILMIYSLVISSFLIPAEEKNLVMSAFI
jgi:cell wall-associated NlpC family hydrolase